MQEQISADVELARQRRNDSLPSEEAAAGAPCMDDDAALKRFFDIPQNACSEVPQEYCDLVPYGIPHPCPVHCGRCAATCAGGPASAIIAASQSSA